LATLKICLWYYRLPELSLLHFYSVPVVLRDIPLESPGFVANFVYEDGVPAWVIYDEGRVVFDVKGGVFAEAFLKDHLENVRVTIRRSSGQTTIRQTDSHTEHVP